MFEHNCDGVLNARKYTCLLCKQKESQAWKIKRHYLKHTQEKFFACSHCDYKSAYINDVKKHTRKHTGEKPFKCQICPYAAADSKSLRVHYKTHAKENGRRVYHCTICSKRFYTKSKLDFHVNLHNLNYNCEVCEKVFDKIEEFENHLSDNHIFTYDHGTKDDKLEKLSAEMLYQEERDTIVFFPCRV
ncbi:gastrula zinc finger protein XlCGF49.1-like [Diaphorina citri]|uniref:Gastrula zinc finger protein XlCGF49.1-like n=1 Tax=Diaphorina citri TaxID=121845 RepID=A0A1S4E9Q7_DIACI|nr:gastrula zinc finger protein XlCGF49.1-like [Diaphorina citri]